MNDQLQSALATCKTARAKTFYEYARYRNFDETLRVLRELMGPPIHHNQHGETYMFIDGTLLKVYTTKPGWAWLTAQRHMMARMVAPERGKV